MYKWKKKTAQPTKILPTFLLRKTNVFWYAQAPVSFQSVEYSLAEVSNLRCGCSCPEKVSQGKHVILTGGRICHGRLAIMNALCELENQGKIDLSN